MSVKTYILPTKEVPCLVTAVSLQEAKITLEKDPKSSFYLASVDENISLPKDLHILEVKTAVNNEEPPSKAKAPELPAVSEGNMLDLHLRFHLPPGLDRGNFETALHSKISQAIEAIIREDGEASE